VAREGDADLELLRLLREGPKLQGATMVRPSKGNFHSGTGIQDFNPDLIEALDRLKGAFERASGPRWARAITTVEGPAKLFSRRRADLLDVTYWRRLVRERSERHASHQAHRRR
jgi:hypothetical protein